MAAILGVICTAACGAPDASPVTDVGVARGSLDGNLVVQTFMSYWYLDESGNVMTVWHDFNQYTDKHAKLLYHSLKVTDESGNSNWIDSDSRPPGAPVPNDNTLLLDPQTPVVAPPQPLYTSSHGWAKMPGPLLTVSGSVAWATLPGEFLQPSILESVSSPDYFIDQNQPCDSAFYKATFSAQWAFPDDKRCICGDRDGQTQAGRYRYYWPGTVSTPYPTVAYRCTPDPYPNEVVGPPSQVTIPTTLQPWGATVSVTNRTDAQGVLQGYLEIDNNPSGGGYEDLSISGGVTYHCYQGDNTRYLQLGNPQPTIVPHHSVVSLPLVCANPRNMVATLPYHPVAQVQAARFGGGFLQMGDSFNYFPEAQSRLNTGIISRSDPLRPQPHATWVSANQSLFIRYLQPHATSAFVRVSLQNRDTGATLYLAGSKEFAPTIPNDGGYGQWGLVRVPFRGNSNWPETVYARLEFVSGAIVYVDAAWIGN